MTRSHARRGAMAVTAVSFLAGCAALPNPDVGAPTAHHSAGLPIAGHCRGAPGAGTPRQAARSPGPLWASRPDARLAAALAAVPRHQAASLAAGVLDQTASVDEYVEAVITARLGLGDITPPEGWHLPEGWQKLPAPIRAGVAGFLLERVTLLPSDDWADGFDPDTVQVEWA